MKIKAHHLLLLSSTLLSASAFASDATSESTTPPTEAPSAPTATKESVEDYARTLEARAVANTTTPTTAEVAAPTTVAAAAPLVAAADTKPAAEAAKDKEAAPIAPGETMPLIMFEDAPLNDVIKTLARQAGINFQFDPRVSNPPPGPDGKVPTPPNVSIRFENVTAQQALEAVLINHSLQLTQDPRTKTSRVTIKDPAAPDPLVTKVLQLKYTSPSNMVGIVKPMISTRGSVNVDNRTSQLIVTATDKELIAVDSLVQTLDSPTKQVLIEARLVETSKSPKSVKGIDWTGTLQAQKFSFGNNALPTVAGTPPTTAIDGNGNVTAVPGTQGTIGGILSDPKLLANTANGFNPATAFLNADGVSAVLSFLNTDADSEVVATPRAVTLDNEKATLSVTRAFPIFTITPGSANSPAGASITYTNLGTILEVTPRISANDMIALKVVPEVSNIDSKDQQTINGSVNIANVYAIRRIEANVVIPSGNTLVMGGLISDTKTTGNTKVPVLGDIPGLGLLFRQDSKKRDKSNLIIFVTPTIVKDTDFHPVQSDFLQSKYEQKDAKDETWWDSGKPHQWTKKQVAND